MKTYIKHPLLFLFVFFTLISCGDDDSTVNPEAIKQIYFASDDPVEISVPGLLDTTLVDVQSLFDADAKVIKMILQGEIDIPAEFQPIFGLKAPAVIELAADLTTVTYNSNSSYSFTIDETEEITQLVNIQITNPLTGNEFCQEVSSENDPLGRNVTATEVFIWDASQNKYKVDLSVLSDVFPGATVPNVTIWQKDGVLIYPCD
ncbi:hypothetical protein [Flammeovirga kamogawensis]|uniref:Uncharacterized protein n=1 Tax=Flammeovirga kamogawensis TaxID=373891 RepID=A0ABX8GWT5_9BACT|nr:hypothetical protein [Flammeovirga kamogawensis]MBB6461674.1 hypothetical protein [Flammeovirga kamogawensis]QWG07400.1 hypothetical protein KM029_00205 [Flammeovirga kamogawensis]TRX69213.1 hypothetical protein EO216_14155 [Flammeovirga kamogawensis]